MISTETFWDQMGVYNQETFLVQIILMGIALVLTYFIFTKPSLIVDNLMKAFLAFVFIWNGTVFFMIYAKGPISIFIGAPLFILLAILFVLDIFKKKIKFRVPAFGWQKYITLFWILLVFLYPLIGSALGHIYPKTCMPMAPCPLTVFTIALVTASIPNIDKKILVLLLPWAILGLPKCLGALDCYEDCILFLAGVYGLILLLKNWRMIGKTQ